MTIRVHIDRLILDDLPVGFAERAVLKAAVETELARLLTAQGLGASLIAVGAVPSLPGGLIKVPNERTPSGLGVQIARAVHGSLSR